MISYKQISKKFHLLYLDLFFLGEMKQFRLNLTSQNIKKYSILAFCFIEVQVLEIVKIFA
jgi:hypothetical protein